jgi:hypothetical protein
LKEDLHFTGSEEQVICHQKVAFQEDNEPNDVKWSATGKDNMDAIIARVKDKRGLIHTSLP